MISEFMNNDNRQSNDFYATRPHDVILLHKYEPSIVNGRIWECACGCGHISETLLGLGATDIYSSDIIDYGYGHVEDFITSDHTNEFDTIITNPPYKDSIDFVIHALNQVKCGGRVIMLLRTLFLEGQERYNAIFKHNNPKYVYIFSKRTYGLIGGDSNNKSSSAMSHSWIIWEKGYRGETIVKWLND
jgi:hypothetical protein